MCVYVFVCVLIFSPLHSTPILTTPLFSSPLFSTSHHSPLHFSPLHSSSHHSTLSLTTQTASSPQDISQTTRCCHCSERLRSAIPHCTPRCEYHRLSTGRYRCVNVIAIVTVIAIVIVIVIVTATFVSFLF